jgi:hypothetical protein
VRAVVTVYQFDVTPENTADMIQLFDSQRRHVLRCDRKYTRGTTRTRQQTQLPHRRRTRRHDHGRMESRCPTDDIFIDTAGQAHTAGVALVRSNSDGYSPAPRKLVRDDQQPWMLQTNHASQNVGLLSTETRRKGDGHTYRYTDSQSTSHRHTPGWDAAISNQAEDIRNRTRQVDVLCDHDLAQGGYPPYADRVSESESIDSAPSFTLMARPVTAER